MKIEQSSIFYSLPKSRTTQQLNGGRKIEKAWDNICTFLNHCTTVTPNQPKYITLTAYKAYSEDLNPEIADKIMEETRQVFGNGESVIIRPNSLPDHEVWHFEEKDLQKVIDYLINGQPWQKFTFGPVELVITFYFKWIDPITKVVLENQELDSSLLIWLSRSCVCSPDFYFPFDEANSDFYNYLNRIEDFLPFKLDPKFLRLRRPNKTKTSYLYSKIK